MPVQRPGTILAGDVVGANDETQKGRLTNVSADDATSNITATFQAVVSPICVVDRNRLKC